MLPETRQVNSRPQSSNSKISQQSKMQIEKNLKAIEEEPKSIKIYIQELESQLRKEKIRRIKSEELLKQYVSKKNKKPLIFS